MSRNFHKVLILSVLSVTLHGCGGGGGGGGGQASGGTPGSAGSAPVPVVNNDPGLKLTPGSLTLTNYVGESQSSDVSVSATRDFPGVVNVQIKDLDGGFTTDMPIRAWGPYDYTATLHTSPALGAGIHLGTVNVSLCKDDPLTCAQPHSGSPWKLPYRIEVKQFATGSGLTALAAVPGMADWTMFQGNAAHAGFAPLTVDGARISPRFSFMPPASTLIQQNTISPVAAADGKAYVNMNGSLYALSEQSGEPLWSAIISTNWSAVGYPTVAQGKVFLPVADTYVKNDISVFDAQTGTVVKQIPASNLPWMSPTVDGVDVYWRTPTSDVSYYNYDTGTSTYWPGKAASQWAIPSAPALDQTYMYYYNTGTVFQVTRAGGAVAKSVRTGRTQFNDGYANNSGSVVLHGDQQALFIETINYGDDTGLGTLFDVDFTNGSMKWAVAGKFRNNPVIAGDTAYALNGDQIVALKLSDGASKWSWPVPAADLGDDKVGIVRNLIVTNNLLFASIGKHVYAIDLSTQKTVWSFDRGGWLTISRNGVLYVSASSGMFAFNLR